ncbi:hypothetical protein BH10ACT9_BH10ACT9_10920 [soil metagenome]
MRLVADSGLWSTEHPAAPVLMTAVLEVSGAVLSWRVDEPSQLQIAFTDLRRADWLWRVVGEAGHVELAAQIRPYPTPGATVDLAHLGFEPNAVAPLRKLAMGHWLRRWWPASSRDGIAALDPALLDAELAVLTDAAGDYFTDKTFDSDVEPLLVPHAAALTAQVAGGDPRVVKLVRACAELADDVGIERGWPELTALLDASQAPVGSTVQSDYALAAGPQSRRRDSGVVAGGVASLRWSAVPAGVFDAAEHTIDWSIVAAGAQPLVVVTVQTAAPVGAAGIPVRLISGSISVTGVLDDTGIAVLPLDMTESGAWNHDWSTVIVTVGAVVAESPDLRDRVRTIARARLAQPPQDAYLAEILAAESDY